jgi:hypothetical protein
MYGYDVNALGLMQVEDYYEAKQKTRGQAEMMAMPKSQKRRPLGEENKEARLVKATQVWFRNWCTAGVDCNPT